jgi:hypothetical protein
MLTKKHFAQVAEIIQENANMVGPNEDFDHGASYAVKQVARELASLFAEQNPRFDKNRFFSACGIDNE